MKKIKANLFDCVLQESVDAICIPTNGNYTQNGLAVMESEHALELKLKYPKTQINLGKYLKSTGSNLPSIIGATDAEGNFIDVSDENLSNKNFKCLIFSFPIKNHFKEESSLEMIIQSCNFLHILCDKFNLKNIILPKFTTKLNWEDVEQQMSSILDDKFTIVFKELK